MAIHTGVTEGKKGIVLAGFRWKSIQADRSFRAALFLSFFLSPATFYTYKIDALDRAGLLNVSGHPIIESIDFIWILGLFILLAAALKIALSFVSRTGYGEEKAEAKPVHFLIPGTVFLAVLWMVPLLAFYPAPGMNDTVFMMNHPFYAVVQFPWFYSLLYGEGALWSRKLFGTAEPVIFVFSLLQSFIFALVLSWVSQTMANRMRHWQAGAFLYIYFAALPMVGDYAIAAVRDGIFSLGLLLLSILILIAVDHSGKEAVHGKPFACLWTAASLMVMLFRNNGIFIVFFVYLFFSVYMKCKRKAFVLFLICAALTVIPGEAILHFQGEQSLFQEKIAVPLQQIGRVQKLGGVMDASSKEFMGRLLPAKEWNDKYSPYTVDFVKWDDSFDRNWLNRHQSEFWHHWLALGKRNPEIYLEGHMTETYALWNLDPFERDVQSRFGYALTDDNVAHMIPASNDEMVVGSLPIPMKVKSAIANYVWNGSRFLGAGFCLWLVLFCCGVFYVQERSRYMSIAVPILVNELTLLAATPASSVFRYGFGFVLILPLLWTVVLERGKIA